MKSQMWIVCLTASLSFLGAPARGDLVISIENTSIASRGTATVDVLLRSTAGMTTPDQINGYGFQLQIVNNGTDNTQLAFAGTQDFGYISNAGHNPPYLFLGDSFDAYPPATPVGGPPTEIVYPGDTFTGSDSTDSGNPVSLASGSTYLLASLTLTALTDAPPNIGDSFTISLVPGAGSGSIFAGTSTFFDNVDYSSGDELSATSFTSTSGTVTVVAVSEPATIVSGLIGIMIIRGIHLSALWLGCKRAGTIGTE